MRWLISPVIPMFSALWVEALHRTPAKVAMQLVAEEKSELLCRLILVSFDLSSSQDARV